MDEATSHLDASTQELIRASLLRLKQNRTTLIISHRLALAYDADTIALMSAGKVIEIGSPEALLGQNGQYRALVTAYEGGAA